MTHNYRWQILVPADQEGTGLYEQWSVLYPLVSEYGKVTGWTRTTARGEEDAWDAVRRAASEGVVCQVEMRRVTVEADAWFTPPPPVTPQEGTDGS